jgi:myosin-crossreactive antigen
MAKWQQAREVLMDLAQHPMEQHHIIGAGIAGLAAAVFLIRDAGVRSADMGYAATGPGIL